MIPSGSAKRKAARADAGVESVPGSLNPIKLSGIWMVDRETEPSHR